MEARSDIQRSIVDAIEHAESCVQIFAKTLTGRMGDAPWIDRASKVRLCALFISNSIDGHIEREFEAGLMDNVAQRSLDFGFRLVKRWPEQGLRMIVALVMRELKHNQHATKQEEREFCEEMLKRLFPETAKATVDSPPAQ